jgi:hypothetical protein
MVKISLFVFFLCSFVLCYGASVTIYNDSPFPLTATILSQDGKTKGSITVTPQNQSTWDDPSPANSVYSQTPYTVIFKCKSGKPFGITSGVSQGGWVTAMQSSGEHYCETDDGSQNSNQQSASQTSPPNQQKDLDLGPP